jgi:hypothetical protein
MTTRNAGIAITLLMLCGCNTMRLFTKPDPFDVHVLPICNAPCEACDEKNPVQVTANPDSSLNALTTEHLLRTICNDRVKSCEVRRTACAEALERAREAQAIR